MSISPKPMVLIILDGWGHCENGQHNPIKVASTPTFNDLYAHYPWTLLQASGSAVGLPDGQMGNSEVGHLHIGSGRKVPQDLPRINDAIQNSSFNNNPMFLQAIQKAKQNGSAIHILGLVSPGGVHSHENHIIALIELIAKHGIERQYLHAFLDGRDVPPRSAQISITRIEQLYQQLGRGQIASLIGRYYAMDRDQRWERTQIAYQLLTEGKAKYVASTASAGLENAYARGENDEFVQATSIHAIDAPAVAIENGDVVIFMNFRADRARQLSFALTEPNFNGFKREVKPALSEFITATEYASNLNALVAYPPISMKNTLGEFLSTQGLKQLRIAETEKYAHVTYFLNGGNEVAFANEARILIPSPKVATYDLQPEMSAIELTNQIVAAIEGSEFDVIICNYANPDMVGHTGVEMAAKKAVEVIDHCMSRLKASLQKVGGEALITADHGNIEQIYDEKTQQPHTAHTTNLVPLIYIGRAAQWQQVSNPSLDDVAPTLLYLMGLKPPVEMTGTNLLQLKE